MIIKKILKTLLLFSFVGGAVLILVWGGLKEKHCVSNIILHNMENNASKIKYITKTKNGVVSITAENVVFLSKNTIKLYDIKATYQTKNKQITVSSDSCMYIIDDKKVHLNNNVNIISDTVNVHTKNAIVDIDEQNIQSSSKTTGTSNGMNFESNGFSVESDGIMRLIKPQFKLSVQNIRQTND